jgi:hypothetical protein
VNASENKIWRKTGRRFLKNHFKQNQAQRKRKYVVGERKCFFGDTNVVKSICHKVFICVPEKTFAE